MFKDFLIVDSILDKPEILIDLSKKIKYDKNKIEKGKESFDIPVFDHRSFGYGERNWAGYRSNFLYEINYQLFNDTFNEIFYKIFSHYKFSEINYYADAHLHFLPECCKCSDESFHRDTSENNNVLMAGVVYLNTDPKPDSGTLLILDDDHCKQVENKFNRLIIYNSHIPHRPQNGFGSNLNDCRLTLTFFVKQINLKS